MKPINNIIERQDRPFPDRPFPKLSIRKSSFVKYGILVAIALVAHLDSQICFAQDKSSKSKQVDPVRVGDSVEVKYFSKWVPGTVLSYENGAAEVEYNTTANFKTSRSFSGDSIRFPNGEGHWMNWRTRDGKLKVEARYIARDEKDVMIREADGTEHTLAIADLSLNLKKLVKATPIPQDANELISLLPFRVGDEIQINSWNNWHDGVIISLTPKSAEVQYEYNDKTTTKSFEFEDMRFPNGEGGWQTWSDASGKFNIKARYISRTKTHVTILKEDGEKIEVPIAKLSSKIRRSVLKAPVTGEVNLIGGVSPLRVDDQVQVKDTFGWYDGVVIEVQPGEAMVEYMYRDKETKKVFELAKIRFPGIESHWMKWKTKEGGFEINARFIRRDATHATLLKEDGKEVKIDIEKLSQKLGKLVKETCATTVIPEWTDFSEGKVITSVLPNLPDFSEIALSPDRLKPEPKSMPGDGGFSFPLKNGDQVSRSTPIGDGDWLLIGTSAGSRYSGRAMLRLFWVNPVTSELIDGPGFPANETIVDYSAQRQQLITSAYIGKGKSRTWGGYYAYQLAPKTESAKPEFRWEGSAEPKTVDPEEKPKTRGGRTKTSTLTGSPRLFLPSDGVRTRKLIGTNHFLTTGTNYVKLYDLKNRSMVYQLNDVKDGYIALHPSGDFFLFEKVSGGLSIHESMTGTQIAFETGKEVACFGFSEDGSKITVVADDKVRIWDLSKSSPPKELLANNILGYNVKPKPGGSMNMVSDRWIWIGLSLYDLEKEMVVWRFGGSLQGHRYVDPFGRKAGGRMLATFVKSSNVMVGTADVPHQAAIDIIDSVAPESMVMLDKGSGVRIQAGGGPIKKHLLDLVKANGWVEDPGAEVTLKGSAGPGKSIEVKYRKPGRFGSSEELKKSFTPWTQSFEVQFGDHSLWKHYHQSWNPGFASSEAELDKAIRESQQSSYDLFERLKVPSRVFYPYYQRGIGESRITASGFQDTEFKKQAESK